MDPKDFNKIIKKNKYQVFLFTGKLNFPLNFAKHTWIVTNEKGEINRYEVLSKKHKTNIKYNHLHVNFLEPTKWFYSDYKENKLFSQIEGDDAKQIIEFIKNNLKNYPYQKKYSYFPGPNSNTFPGWILKNNPKTKLKMPLRAIGKNYFKS